MASGLRSTEVERNLRTIFKRCVQCPTQIPTCPDCQNGQICSLVPVSCDACAYMTCIPNPSPAPSSSKPNVGAIAGGIIGGVVVMAVAMFFLWRFRIKKKREQQELEGEWDVDNIAQQKNGRQFSAMQSDAVSTRTRGSIANSILSRASNIIQIAYIPGVTNRSGSGHNSFLANTPVPPIPAQYANNGTPKSPLSNESDALFFRPGSTYSDGSSIRSGNRDTQYTRQSITPSLARSSMVSDVYMDDATTEPMPATQVWRAAPRMVSVKGNSPLASPASESPRSANSPATLKVVVPGQRGLNDSSSRINSNRSFAKATEITVGRGKGRFPIARQPGDLMMLPSTRHVPAKSSPLVETATDSEDEDEHARARRSLLDATTRAADPSPLSAQPIESPFFDDSDLETSASSSTAFNINPYAAMSASVGDRTRRTPDRGPGGLSAVIEEASKRASQGTENEESGANRDASPFSDAHATK